MADNILNTYGDLSRKEDVVLNAVEILTATETQIFNMLGKGNAINTVHAYQVDTLRAPSGTGVAENADYTLSLGTTPTRLTNICNTIAVPFSVSKTQQAVQHYQGGNELTRQTNKALKDWGNDAEYNLIRSTLSSGVSGTVPQMSKQTNGLTKHVNNIILKAYNYLNRNLCLLSVNNAV